ncbi:hypothetical protein VNO80_14760 [Phaseolus coccineus]|uniref:Uncharacterized protein n=1 Tax=Phaseolus coccineus TaxID=3886 RepID=A0AAN9R6B7_PHACN
MMLNDTVHISFSLSSAIIHHISEYFVCENGSGLYEIISGSAESGTEENKHCASSSSSSPFSFSFSLHLSVSYITSMLA